MVNNGGGGNNNNIRASLGYCVCTRILQYRRLKSSGLGFSAWLRYGCGTTRGGEDGKGCGISLLEIVRARHIHTCTQQSSNDQKIQPIRTSVYVCVCAIAHRVSANVYEMNLHISQLCKIFAPFCRTPCRMYPPGYCVCVRAYTHTMQQRDLSPHVYSQIRLLQHQPRIDSIGLCGHVWLL